MPQYVYTARTATGENVAGTITAPSKREMLHALSEQALYPLHVERGEPARSWWRFKHRIKAQHIADNLRQLGDLLQNGVPMLAALDILATEAAHRELAEVLTEVRDRVADGTALDDAMARHPNVFGELTVSMVRAGTEGAFLEESLDRTAAFLELQEEMKGRLVGAMFYPAFLATIGFIVTFCLIVFFVPKFAELFARLEREGGGLPWATVVLLGLSDVLGRWGLVLAAALVGLVVWLRHAASTPRGRLLIDRGKLKIPLAGKIFLGAAVSRFCRVLGTLLRNGVPLLKSLDISSASAGNVVLAQAIRDAAENISSGETLAQPLAACGLIPRPIMAMIRVAEESNNLDKVLVDIADSLDRRISRQLDMMLRMVEPVLLLIMGLVIGFVMVALLLPVFDMSSAIG